MKVLNKIGAYLNIFKKQEAPTEKGMGFNLKAMHTINRISIFMFLGALVFLALKFIF